MLKNKFFFLLFAFFLPLASLKAADEISLFNRQTAPKIIINHRILAKVNGKPITTYDLMKKMDLTFYRRYPEYASSIEARHEFYIMAWRHFLDEIIDKELILADAKESKVTVTAGDVRQEMETTFGPNIAANLDKIELSFDEASKMVEEEMIMDRMISGRVHGKALRQITPIVIRKSYEEHIANPANCRSNEWTYRCVTIKDRDLKKTEATANYTSELIAEGVALDDIANELKERKLTTRSAKITVSKPIKSNEQELSEKYKEALASVEVGMASQPFSIKSRSTQSTVYKILVVDEKIPGGIPTYNELESSIKQRLLNQAVDSESILYLDKLREHYHIRQADIEANLPTNFQPFSLIKN